MVRCFLTGVEFALHDAFVLNRRDARDLLDVLKDRVACLQRVIAQFSPLDTPEAELFARAPKGAFVPKRHRLVCKAVADALAPGFPEIQEFGDHLAPALSRRNSQYSGFRPAASAFAS
jgi:hypothetical protein